MKTLWLLGEENISDDIPNILYRICNGNITFNNVSYEHKIINKKLFYKISGIESEEYDHFYYSLISRAGNGFVDYLAFTGDNPPEEDSIPFFSVESTKNNGKQSGNMLSQRSSKSIPLLEKWGNIPYIFLINNPLSVEDNSNSFSQGHFCEFATMEFLNAEILISQTNKIGYKKYNAPFKYDSIEEIVYQENLKETRKGKIPSRVFYENGVIKIQANLSKNKGTNDPGEGYIASRAYMCRCLCPDAEIRIINHGRDLKYFQSKNNKLINVLKIVGVTVELEDQDYVIEKQPGIYQKKYWKYSRTGEKIATIFMEQEFVKNGWEVLFKNHAGCEKSFVTINSEFFTTQKTSGLPDLVLYHKDTKRVYVIEGEITKKYKQGLEQCRQPAFDEFIQREIMSRLPSDTKVSKYLCTYGKYNQEPEVLFNLTEDFNINYNWNAMEIV